MNIYQIDAAIMALADPETGEISDWEAFEQLQLAKETKIENVVCWYKNLMANVEAIKAEEAKLQERRKELENQASRKLQYIREALSGQPFETARCQVKWRKTTSCKFIDESVVVAWLEKHGHHDAVKYTTPTANKNSVTALLKEKKEIPGAELVAGLSMSVK